MKTENQKQIEFLTEQLAEAVRDRNFYQNRCDETNHWLMKLTPEDYKAKRILRGHRKPNCKCRFCSVPSITIAAVQP